MLLWISSQFRSMILALHSSDSPGRIALAVAIGSIAGWMPFNFIVTPIILIFLYILNINTSFGLLSVAIVTLFSYVLDPFAGHLGRWILTDIPALKPLWTSLFNCPIVPFTNFNNTVVMGSFVIGLLLALPLYFLSQRAVIRYRNKWHDQLEKTKFFKWIRTSKLVLFLLQYKGS